MGIWRRSGCSQDGFAKIAKEVGAADDSGEAAAAELGGLIGDWSVMSCQRSQAPG
jgi:hypothetical protein